MCSRLTTFLTSIRRSVSVERPGLFRLMSHSPGHDGHIFSERSPSGSHGNDPASHRRKSPTEIRGGTLRILPFCDVWERETPAKRVCLPHDVVREPPGWRSWYLELLSHRSPTMQRSTTDLGRKSLLDYPSNLLPCGPPQAPPRGNHTVWTLVGMGCGLWATVTLHTAWESPLPLPFFCHRLQFLQIPRLPSISTVTAKGQPGRRCERTSTAATDGVIPQECFRWAGFTELSVSWVSDSVIKSTTDPDRPASTPLIHLSWYVRSQSLEAWD